MAIRLSNYPVKVTNQNRTIYFLGFINLFKSKEIVKLTIAPIIAKTIVFKTSSELILGTILKTVPAAVPVWIVLFDSITR